MGSDGSWYLSPSFLQGGAGRFPKDLIPPEVQTDDPHLLTKSLKNLLQGPPDWYRLKSLGGIFTPMIHFGIEF
jgi:hypothetical protein